MNRAKIRRLMAGLALRLAFMMLLALLPLGLLSLGQSRNILNQAVESQRLAAMGETIQAAAPEVLLIRSVQATAQVLALALGQVSQDPALCLSLVQQTAAANTALSLVAFVPLSGQMNCATRGAGTDMSGNDRFRLIIAKDDPQLLISPDGSVSGQAVVVITHPVRDATGQRIGFASVSLTQTALSLARDQMGRQNGSSGLLALTTFDSEGTVLTSSAGMEDVVGHLPESRSLKSLSTGQQSFFAQNAAGQERLFTVVPMTGGLFLLGTWRPMASGVLSDLGLHPFAVPVMMWLAGVAVAVLGAERLVTRHLRRLSRAMRKFTYGERTRLELTLRDPPREIADLAHVYGTLTTTILRDEAELENLLRQKEELLREVHHRTGNSLQLIASILRMHRRETHDPEMVQLIDNLHDRVMSLSTVHLGLYRIAGRADVAVDTLIAEVISKVGAIHWRAGRRDAIQSQLQPMMLTAQQAVPLALLLAEILSCFPAAEMDGMTPSVHIRLDTDKDGLARLSIAGPQGARGTLLGEREGAPSVIAARLIRSFVTQLDGKMVVSDDGSQVVATITFAIRLAGPEPAQEPALGAA